MEEKVNHKLSGSHFEDPLEAVLVGMDNYDNEEEIGYVKWLDALSVSRKFRKPFDTLDRPEGEEKKFKPSIEEPPVLELKPLPSHLKYAYLGKSDTLPVIVSADWNDTQKENLLRVMREYKTTIGGTIADIQGISPSFCMHKILLEGEKPTIEQQRRLNPIMKDVIKKEIIKWLDAGIIYSISDSSWVSLVQCVPKKGGMTVVKNETNEFIPTRTVTG